MTAPTLSSRTRPLPRPWPLALLALALTAPARGGWFSPGGCDDCAPGTRHARCEYGAESACARRLRELNCAGLTAYAEWSRVQANARLQATSLRAPDSRPVRTPPAPNLPAPPLPERPTAEEPASPPPPPASNPGRTRAR